MVRTAGRCTYDRCTRPEVAAYAAWHQMVPTYLERWCTEANEATKTHCNNPVTSTYSVWAHCVHVWQCRCQEDPVSLPSGILEKTTRVSPHHVAQHRPTGSETPPPYASRSSRSGSEPPSVESTYGATQPYSCMPEMTMMTSILQRLMFCYYVKIYLQIAIIQEAFLFLQFFHK